MRRFAIVGVVVAGLLAASCGGEGEPLGPTATVPQATTTTDPYAIPQVIDEAYVNRVLAGLDREVGAITRKVMDTRTISTDVLDHVRAIYVGAVRQRQIDLLAADLQIGFFNYRLPPGDRKTTVAELLSAAPACIFARVIRDYSAVATELFEEVTNQWVALIPANSNELAFFNPTGWTLTYDGFEKGGSAPEEPCAES